MKALNVLGEIFFLICCVCSFLFTPCPLDQSKFFSTGTYVNAELDRTIEMTFVSENIYAMLLSQCPKSVFEVDDGAKIVGVNYVLVEGSCHIDNK